MDYKLTPKDILCLIVMLLCFIAASHIDYLFIMDGLVP